MWHLLDTWVVPGHETSSVIVVWVHVCVRSLDSCTESDNNLSFCLCDWSTLDTRDHHCPGLFLVQTFLFSQQTTWWWLVVTLPIRMWGLREGGGQILSWTNLEDIDCIDFGGSPSTPHLEGGRYKGTKAFQEPGPLWLLYYQTGAGALNYFLNPTQETVDKGLLPNLTQQVVLGGHLQRLFSGQGSGLSNIPGFVLLPDGSVQSWMRLSCRIIYVILVDNELKSRTTNSISSVPAKSNN